MLLVVLKTEYTKKVQVSEKLTVHIVIKRKLSFTKWNTQNE
jgi:hypothetical protein